MKLLTIARGLGIFPFTIMRFIKLLIFILGGSIFILFGVITINKI